MVYDLYDIASEEIVDIAAVRARDIAAHLNTEEKSPYHEQIKFPGSPRRKGGIALSTAVSALKPLVENKGLFEQIGLTELETQQAIIQNYMLALEKVYGGDWDSPANAFMYASGFVAAIDFFKQMIVPYCNNKKSFTVDTIRKTLRLDATNLILQSEVKGLGGKDAPKKIYDRLVESFKPATSRLVKFEI